jgi:hypothetical protein
VVNERLKTERQIAAHTDASRTTVFFVLHYGPRGGTSLFRQDQGTSVVDATGQVLGYVNFEDQSSEGDRTVVARGYYDV